MSYRIQEIDRIVREAYCSKSPAIEMRDRFMPNVDLDEEQLELFAQYVAALQGIGINLQDERLQDALNAYPYNMEAAIQAVLEYAQVLQQKHQDFQDQYHATNCLTKALREGWKP
ncbi:hypothetical protein [Aliterella atlantica]|uniref:Uncharacterized protein n=1 Tax=Aliterella atlantica CENA595 TaxID=1618023 RepID=A0A0D8ZMH0_9CYAN|nr:hypothetical protein [Aliterella atlantica]KJH69639.1 hypothetical protein UH38_22680 [Aliterella atlantica CENA595]